MKRFAYLLLILTCGVMAAPSRKEFLKKSDWVIVGHRLIPFRVDGSCAAPSKWRFGVDKVLFTRSNISPLKQGQSIEVADANYDMLEVECKRRRNEMKEPDDFREGKQPVKLVLFLFRRGRLGIKSRIQLVASGAHEPVSAVKAITKAIEKLK